MRRPAPRVELRDAISLIEDIIAAARAGKMAILVDHEDRENEGDLITVAEFADGCDQFHGHMGAGHLPPMTAERIDRLGLPMMAVNNSRAMRPHSPCRSRRARGWIPDSAADRALTVATAINEQNTMAAIATPGQRFSGEAGGVLVRAGYTEASVDISQLLGCIPRR